MDENVLLELEDEPNEPDALSAKALREAARAVASTGWDTDVGRALIAVLDAKATSWAISLDRRCGRRRGTTQPADVLCLAWSTVDKFPDRVATAKRPWAYLWTSVKNQLLVENVRDACLSDGVWRLYLESGCPPPTAVRLGEVSIDEIAHRIVREPDRPAARLSAQTTRLVELIVEAGGCPRLWAAAVERAVEVIANARRSYEEHEVRRDAYLLHELGLRPRELGALAALLIGSRRGDRRSESLLLALHGDLNITVDAVPRARQRLRTLLSRPEVRSRQAVAVAA